jgi:hypothetical protein
LNRLLKRPRRRILLVLAGISLLLLCLGARGQDTAYARMVINRLCARDMHGRGYVRKGIRRSAAFIKTEYRNNGLLPLSGQYGQSFSISVNTFPGAMRLKINNLDLMPGVDFMIDPSSPGIKGNFAIYHTTLEQIMGNSFNECMQNASGQIMVINTSGTQQLDNEGKNTLNRRLFILKTTTAYDIKAVLEITDAKLSFGKSTYTIVRPYIRINGSIVKQPIESAYLSIKNRYIKSYTTSNIAGYLPGKLYPDSFLVFTAHYDHLGYMGRKTWFPGANDNASGVAMMLSLAQYFSKHPQDYSLLFLAFSAEEAGLLGSRFYVEHPLKELTHIKFLVNLDLVGTGDEGITVVNANEFPDYFRLLQQINVRESLLAVIKARDAACNSDHCPFYQKHVHCFFIYTMGGIQAYHDPADRPESLPLTAFAALVQLLILFSGAI